jgi:hypothetical protein
MTFFTFNAFDSAALAGAAAFVCSGLAAGAALAVKSMEKKIYFVNVSFLFYSCKGQHTFCCGFFRGHFKSI